MEKEWKTAENDKKAAVGSIVGAAVMALGALAFAVLNNSQKTGNDQEKNDK